MKQRPRIYYSQAQIAQMWDRWQEGVSLNEIGRMSDFLSYRWGQSGGIESAHHSPDTPLEG